MRTGWLFRPTSRERLRDDVRPRTSLLEATIPELQKAMETGELTAVELVDFYLARIAAYDNAGPKLNAFILVNPAARTTRRRLSMPNARIQVLEDLCTAFPWS